MRLLWLFGFSRNGESLMKARKRAGEAAMTLAEEHHDILLVGHGLMNLLIARALKKADWIGPSRPGPGHWGYGVYEKAAC